MSNTFSCSYCEKQYPHSATLIGRKLRCSGCKNVIQLMADGSVKKIMTAAAVGSGTAKTSAAQQKSLTHRQKKQVEKTVTRSIERSRSSLNAAAQMAIDHMDSISREQSSTGAGQTTVQSGQASRSRLQTVRTAAGRRQVGLPPLIIGAVTILLTITVLLVFLWQPSREHAALESFASSVAADQVKHPLRMKAYRDRMWLHTRDGKSAPPIILNADKAEISFVMRIDWAPIAASCNALLKDLSLLRDFGMWVSSDKQVLVKKLWEDYEDKSNLSMFYTLMKENDVKFLHCESVPEHLLEEGVPRQVVYIASLLLAGTGDRSGGPCRDFGLASDEHIETLEIYEFNGAKSLSLIEKQDEYETSSGAHYSGLIAGFINISEGNSEFRVIDIRFSRSMKEFYEDRYNPLRMISDSARLRMLSEFIESDTAAGPGAPDPAARQDAEVQP